MGLKEYCVSSKLTISQNDDYHLFEEAFNNSFVYLQLDDCKELDVKSNHFGGTSERQITVGIPIETWRSVIEGWLDSYWAKHPGLDHTTTSSE
jgi:hypothetical protein|tara:strand:+ start:186 stop:464 length:279 start_codon:yes stop_codon:yes gene_type:complete